jgi:hypothetical protein
LRQELTTHTVAYSIPLMLRLRGPLRTDAVRDALADVIRQHDALRTSLAATADGLVQVVGPLADRFDLLVETVDEADLPAVGRQEAEQPFDVVGGPLARFRMLRSGGLDHTLLATFHHTIADGWSVSVFIRDLRSAYQNRLAGGGPPSRSDGLQFTDVAAWQRAGVADGTFAAELAYWRERLAGVTSLRLPTRDGRDATGTSRGRRHVVHLDAALVAGLDARARQEGVTLYMTLLAGFAAVLSRLSGTDDVPVGSPFSGRDAGGTEGIVGFMVNILPVRVSTSGNPTVRELLARVRDVVLGAYTHQAVPGEVLLADVPGAAEAVQHAYFTHHRAPDATANWPDLEVDASFGQRDEPEAGVTLELEIAERADGADAVFLFPLDAFDDDVVPALAVDLLRLYAAFARDPSARLAGIVVNGSAG